MCSTYGPNTISRSTAIRTCSGAGAARTTTWDTGVRKRPFHKNIIINYYNIIFNPIWHRLEQVGLPITRPPERLGRYTMVKHVKRKPLAHAVRLKLVHTSQKRYRSDGLNTLKYEVFRIDTEKLYTRILVDVGDMPDYVRSFEVKRTNTATVLKRKWK